MLKNEVIYTITTIPRIPHKFSRCVGFFFNLKIAEDEVINNSLDISEEGYYSYCVIEEVKPGIYFFPRMEKWYKWNPQTELYDLLIEKPSRFNNVCCFGIG